MRAVLLAYISVATNIFIMAYYVALKNDEIIRRIELKNPGKFSYEYLEDFHYDYKIDRNPTIKLVCKIHNEPFEVKLKSAIRYEISCPLCKTENYGNKSIKESIELLNKLFPNKYEVIDTELKPVKLVLRCKDCGEIIKCTPREIRTSILKTSICKKCKTLWTEELVIQRWKIKWEDRYEILNIDFSGKTWLTAIITVKCNLCSKIVSGRVKDLLHSFTPCDCDKTKIMSPEIFLKKSKEVWGESVFEYINIDVHTIQDKATLRCLKHDKIFEQRVTDHLGHKNGCPECKREVNVKNGRLSTEEFIKRGKIIYGDQFTYEKTHYVDYHTPVIVTCKEHGDVEVIPEHFFGKTGCPLCMQNKDFISKGEQFVIRFLKENNIEFEFHKRFDKCVYKGSLEFDFYLPNYKCCIEYQGEQHFKPIYYFYDTPEEAEKAFKEIQIRDNIKRKYCKENNIDLIEIPYWITYYKADKWLKQYFKNKINLFEEECKKKRPL